MSHTIPVIVVAPAQDRIKIQVDEQNTIPLINLLKLLLFKID